MSFNKRPFKKFRHKSKPVTTDEKIKNFVLRNSKNGYYTKVSTLSFKFEISNFDKSKFCILSIDDLVNLFFDASFEKPPDSVAPLKEQRFIIKY